MCGGGGRVISGGLGGCRPGIGCRDGGGGPNTCGGPRCGPEMCGLAGGGPVTYMNQLIKFCFCFI